MLIYPDANIVIYLIEQPPGWGPRAAAAMAAIRASSDLVLVSHLTRIECRVRPLTLGDSATLAQFDAFFASSDVRVVDLTEAVCDRATAIRAAYRFKTVDALHLAAAVEHGCHRFLTNDARLSHFPDITVEVLP